MIETITNKNKVLAIIIFTGERKAGVNFVTPSESTLQLGTIRHARGTVIPPHTHNIFPRTINKTQEVLVIQKGSIKVNFYDENFKQIETRTLNSGDTILLADDGHGFEVLEECEIIEIKQGPYAGEADKTRFKAV